MLDKLLLNNQILASKAVVRKVRVNLVNKQVQKLRRLKHLIDKHKDNRKLKAKLSKYTEILACVKAAKSNEILRLALINQKNPQNVITNGLSTPEETALALYFAHRTIKGLVEHLKSVLQIDESDASWRDSVAEPSKRKQKQMRTEKKQKLRQERKARRELDQKRNQWIVENVPHAKQNIENTENHDDRITSIQSSFKEADVEPVRSKKRAKIENNEAQEVPTASRLVASELDDEGALDEEDDEDASSTQHAVDDFFLTQSGDHYLSTVIIDRKQPDQPDDGFVRRERRLKQSGQHIQFDKKRVPKNNGKAGNLEIEGSDRARKAPHHELHPSWAAKQKHRTIQSFQGSKIVFNDGPSLEPSISKKPAVKISNGKSEAKLHPSWEAKQKLKPSIAEFEGKKVVFKDE